MLWGGEPHRHPLIGERGVRRVNQFGGIVVVTPGSDANHPWVTAFHAALNRALPTQLCAVELTDQDLPGIGARAANPGTDMAAVQALRSPVAGCLRRQRAASALAGVPPDMAKLQLYTNDCLPLESLDYLFTDVLLATMADHASQIPGYVWDPAVLDDALRRERQVLEAAGLIFVPTKWLESWILQNLPAAIGRKVRRVGWGPGIDMRDIGADRVHAAEGVHSQNFRVLFVGNDGRRKGLDQITTAMSLVRARRPDAELLVIGRTDVRVGPGIRHGGYLDPHTSDGRDALRDAYRGASLLTLPSNFDPVGTAQLEAMHAALPVIAYDTCSMSEFVIPRRTGWLVEPGSDLAPAVLDAALDDEVRMAMGAHAWRHVEEFTWDQVVNRMVACIQEEVGRR